MSNELDLSKPEELQTRDGRAVRIYATDHAGKYSVNGAVKNNSGWCCASWMLSGSYGDDSVQRDTDLVRKHRRVTGWINLYKVNEIPVPRFGDSVFATKEEARQNKVSIYTCLGQIYIDAEIQT